MQNTDGTLIPNPQGARILEFSDSVDNIESLGERGETLRFLNWILSKWVVSVDMLTTGDNIF